MPQPKFKMLVLDDDPARVEHLRTRFPNADLHWAETVETCIPMLAEEWDVIRLDHDLGGEIFVDSNRTDCGMEIVRYILKNKPEHLKETIFIVHSKHERAGEKMTAELTAAGYDCTYVPFSWGD